MDKPDSHQTETQQRARPGQPRRISPGSARTEEWRCKNISSCSPLLSCPGSTFTPHFCHPWGHFLLILPKVTLYAIFQILPGFSVLNTENWKIQRCYFFNYRPPAVSHDEQCVKIILKSLHPLENSFLDCISCQIYLAVFYKSIALKEFYLSTKRTTRTIKFLLVLLEK